MDSIVDLVKSVIRIASISNPGNDNERVPSHQIQYLNKIGNAITWFPFGFHAVPDEEDYTIVIKPNAKSEEKVSFPTSMLRRPRLKVGESVLFHPGTGSMVKMCADGSVEINAAGEVRVDSPSKIKASAPEIEFEGDVDVTGTLGVSGAVQLDDDLDVTGNFNLTGTSQLTGAISFSSTLFSSTTSVEHTTHTHFNTGNGPPLNQS